MHAWIEGVLAERSDIGLRKAIANMIFDPYSPFDSKPRRKPKVWFVFAVILFAAFWGCFVCFNVLR
ncbi:MAG: hypothetical protein DMG49_24345 [Acidobacteria bacterium]|nr:MAG: hypothetical protein DMG49_24345 [Acidobacteriota bacterium]